MASRSSVALSHVLMPPALVTPLAKAVDHVAMAPLTGRARTRKQRVDAVPPARRVAILERTAEAYADAHPLEDVDRFFPVTPPEVTGKPAGPTWRWPDLTRRGFEVVDLTWPSVTPPHVDDPVIARRFAEAPNNRVGAARLYRRRTERQRRVVILIHGYRSGNYAVEEQVWPVRWWLRRGFDAALFTLPFHGVRHGGEKFFTPDPRVTNETIRQAIIDARSLVRWLREHEGYRVVGAMGMSLGGYTASLLGTIEPLDLLSPFIPLGGLADSVRDGGWLNGTPDEQRAQYEACLRAYRPIDPLARSPKVDASRVVVIAGEGDRITPPRQAERLANHFRAPCVRFPGGHLLQAGRGRGFRALDRLLRDQGWRR